MQKIFFTLTMAATLVTGITFTGCQTQAQKEIADKYTLKHSNQEMRVVQTAFIVQEQKMSKAEEWNKFKREADIKIENNERHLAELKVKIKKSGKKMDDNYAAKVEKLEQQNREMNERIEAFEKNLKGDWQSFKHNFNRDMDKLGQELKEVRTDKKRK